MMFWPRKKSGRFFMIALILAIVVVTFVAFLRSSSNTSVISTVTSSSTQTTSSSPLVATSTTATSIIILPPAPLTGNPNFGISAGGGLAFLDQADLMTRLEAIKQLGVGWVRFDVDWSAIQGSNSSTYNWAGYDRVVADLNTIGLKGLGIIDYTPTWERPANCLSAQCAPVSLNKFATFAQAVVKRYSSQGMHTWEIWNEPNITQFWQQGPNISAYATLLRDSYITIKAADPSAIVLSGGLARVGTGNGNISPVDFLTGLYAAGDEPYFDAVALHPYSYPNPPSYAWQWNPWYQIAGTTPSLRSVMIANGDASKQIWLTEYGAPTNGPGSLATPGNYLANPSADHVTEAFQAQMMAQAINIKDQTPYLGPLFFYTYQDSGTSNDTVENFFGVVRFDGSDKPAYTTIQNLIAE